jgi:hypothetical protein
MGRPLPSVVTLGGVIDVTYLLDTPHGFMERSIYRRGFESIETVQSSEFGEQGGRQKLFMQLSSLQGSILENRIFEDEFQVQSVSTAKLMIVANTSQSADHHNQRNKHRFVIAYLAIRSKHQGRYNQRR